MRPWILLPALLCGCGGTGVVAGSPDMATGLTTDQVCVDIATASCAKLDACRPNDVAMRYGDMTTCVSRNKASCLVSFGAADTGRTLPAGEACAMAYASASCQDFVFGSIAACQSPPGVRMAGMPCTFNAQCASAFCAYTTGAACGTCAATPTVGQSCATSLCGPGQACAGATSTCQVAGAAGAPCSSTAECQVGMACVGATAMAAGTCMPGAATSGAACDRTNGPNCDARKGLYCSTPPKLTAGMCVNYLYAMAGQPCGFTAGMGASGSTYTLCTGAAECWIAKGMNAGTCLANAAEGKVCDTTNGPGCLGPAHCVTSGGGTAGTCQLSDPTKC